MQAKMTENTIAPRGNCIGCQDCKGLCQALVELAFLPEAVLKSGRAAR